MNYLITEIKELNKQKVKIVVNYDTIFTLYKGECRKLKIFDGTEITEDMYNLIMNEILPKRAKERSLYLLSRRSMTENQLRTKLKEGFYPEKVIDDILLIMKGYSYIDDTYFATNYVSSKINSKSKKQIQMELINKGVARDVIDEVINDTCIDEKSNIKKWMDKKHISMENSSKEDINKFCAFLLRKGYNYETIRSTLKVYEL